MYRSTRSQKRRWLRKSTSRWLNPNLARLTFAVQVVFGVELAADEAHHIVASRIRNVFQPELLHVFPVGVVTGVVEMFCAEVSIKTVSQRIVGGTDVAA